MMRASFLRLSPLLLLAAALVGLAVFFAPGAQPGAQPVSAQDNCDAPGGARNVKVTAGNAKLTLTWEEPTSWGDWDSDGYRYYIVHWRRADADPELSFNLIDNGRSRRPPTTSYVFTGTYEEELSNPRRFQNHTVVNGTKYDLDVQTAYTNRECGHTRGQQVQASGTPVETLEIPSADATLSGLELANAADDSDAPVDRIGYISEDRLYLAPMLREVDFITVKPTATAGDLATITVRREMGGTPETVASGAISSRIHIAPKADSSVPHNIFVTVTAENGSDTLTYHVKVYQYPPVSFQGVTVEDKTYTEGREISFLNLSETERDALKLPQAAGVFYAVDVTYEATGLPAGLTMGHDRHIRGTPTAKTDTPATVTYKVTDAIGGSASLTFQVTVNPPVAFDAEDLNTYYGRVITYTAGQAAPLTVTLPQATGGTGTLTYELVFRTAEAVPPSVPGAGVNLDPSTRVLTIDGNSNVNRIALRDTGYAISYRARDENGATASAASSISVIGPPTLSNIEDQSYTAGSAVSLTLGAASGPWWKMVAPLSYELAGQVDGLAFSGGSNPTLSGTPTVAGVTAMTYTATDGNGVSASRNFTVTVVNGPNVPTAAPASLAAVQVSRDAVATWDAVTGATAYVVQVIADGGSYPDRPVNSTPAGVALSFLVGSVSGVSIEGLSDGDYKVRVAARNDDGVGPWSAEASFTVKVGGL